MTKALRVAMVVAILGLTGCAAMTQPIEVTPALIDALGKDPASACMVNQGTVSAAMYGNGNATSTFCRTNAAVGTLSVGRDGTITITHGSPNPASVNLPATISIPASPTK